MRSTFLFYLEMTLKIVLFIELAWILLGLGRYLHAIVERTRLENTLSRASAMIKGLQILKNPSVADSIYVTHDRPLLKNPENLNQLDSGAQVTDSDKDSTKSQ